MIKHSNKFLFLLALITFILVPNSESIAQKPVASFTATPNGGCSPLFVHFQNYSTGTFLDYFWDFGTGYADTTHVKDPDVTFPNDGVFTVILIVKNTSTGDTAIARKDITINKAANLIIDDTGLKSSYCRSEEVPLKYSPSSATFDSLVWDFDDGTKSRDTINTVYHAYNTQGTKSVKLYSYLGQCADTSTHTINVLSTKASFITSSHNVCYGDSVVFTLGDTSGINNFTWFPEGQGGGNPSITGIDNYVYYYNEARTYLPELVVVGSGGTCELSDKSSVALHQPVANISYNNSAFCEQSNVIFAAGSEGSPSLFFWDFGNDSTGTTTNPILKYDAGNYHVTLKVEDDYGCSDTTSDNITINTLPVLQSIGADVTICLGDTTQLSASGGHFVEWTPPEYISNPFSYSPQVWPKTTSEYTPQVTDSVTGCKSDKLSKTKVTVVMPPSLAIAINPIDTSIVIGASITIQVDSLGVYNYLWSPDKYISCLDCASPSIQALDNGDNFYTLTISDIFGCSSNDTTIRINVTEAYSIGVPKAFTPNGDKINDIIKVDGWGIKRLIEFSVFNRYGTKVFSTDNIDEGWDGTYKDKDQNIDTYTYYLYVEMWDDTKKEIQGTFSLYR
jgi:gliding motility-associated-like protein